MKKTSKGLALIGLTTIVVGISGLFQATNKINKEMLFNNLVLIFIKNKKCSLLNTFYFVFCLIILLEQSYF